MVSLFKDGVFGAVVRRRWEPSAGYPGSRAPLDVDCFVPARLAVVAEPLSLDLAGRFADADAALRGLAAVETAARVDAAARPLLRSEAVSSSRIEGLVLGHRRLARAVASGRHDRTATLVNANVTAVGDALQRIDSGGAITTELLCELHAVLLAGTVEGFEPGRLRSVQNWIGGSAFEPSGAVFVPPPPDLVAELVDDLCVFAGRSDMPATLQAAVAHAQFETIHPFADGNGRIGRILALLVLRRRGLIPVLVPPLSLALLAARGRYVEALQAYRFTGRRPIFELFADACMVAADGAAQLAHDIAALQEQWRAQAGHPRRDSAAEALIQRLPEVPVVDLAVARELTGRSDQACNEAINRLVAVDVLRPTSATVKRGRMFESVGLFALLDQFEQRYGSPGSVPAATRR